MCGTDAAVSPVFVKVCVLDKTSYEAWKRMETGLLQRGSGPAPGSDAGWLSASPASSLCLGFLPCKLFYNLLIRSAA